MLKWKFGFLKIFFGILNEEIFSWTKNKNFWEENKIIVIFEDLFEDREF